MERHAGENTGRGGQRSKLLFLVTEDWYFCSHRLPIARAARDAGFDVAVATRVQNHADVIHREKLRLIPLKWKRRSINPWNETRALAELIGVYRRERPDLVHHIALKPTLYGSIAARVTGTPAYVNTVAGLGYVFTSREIKARVLGPVMRFAFRRLLNRPNSRLILQNPDDLDVLTRYCNVRPEYTHLIRGSGVDMSVFTPTPEPDGMPNVTMVSRMLWSKGVGELVDVARRLKQMGEPIKVTLVGAPDPENPASIPVSQLKKWQTLGLVEWLGHRDDVTDIWSKASIAVLPTTYGEGVPKVLIEAAACARPIIATDVPGCREIVIDGESGILVPPKNSDALLEAIRRLACDPGLRKRMGERGRTHAANGFSEETVIEQTLSCYESLISGRKT